MVFDARPNLFSTAAAACHWAAGILQLVSTPTVAESSMTDAGRPWLKIPPIACRAAGCFAARSVCPSATAVRNYFISCGLDLRKLSDVAMTSYWMPASSGTFDVSKAMTPVWLAIDSWGMGTSSK
jgi:hypothetical protein